MVHRDAAPAAPGRRQADDGVSGDPSRASAELGRLGLAHIVTTSVAAIRAATAP